MDATAPPQKIECPVVGTKYRGAKVVQLVESLTENHCGEHVSLEREPNNHVDPNAIKVIWGGEFLGYVPAHVAKILAPIIDSEEIGAARIISTKRSSTLKISIEISPE